MVIPELGNTFPQLGHDTAQIVGPEIRKDNYKRKILSWIGTHLCWMPQWLEHQHVKLETRVQAPLQNIIFSVDYRTSQQAATV